MKLFDALLTPWWDTKHLFSCELPWSGDHSSGYDWHLGEQKEKWLANTKERTGHLAALFYRQ